MAGSRYNWDEMRGVSSQLDKLSAEIEKSSNDVRSRVQAMAGAYEGTSRQAYDTQIEQWKSNAGKVKENLDALAKMLKDAAEVAERTEAELTRVHRGA